MKNYQETESRIVVVIAGMPIVDVGQTAVITVTTDQTVTVSKLYACLLSNPMRLD